MRVYHQRVRDGERVVWCSDAGRIRRLDRGTIDPACRVLLDVLGPAVARALCDAWQASLPAEWDRTEDEIREWAAGRG